MRQRLAPFLAIAAVLSVSSLARARVARAEEIRAVSEKLDERIDSIEIQGGRAVLKLATRTIPLEQVKQIRFADERASADAAGAKVILSNRDEIRGTLGSGTTDNF